MKQFYLILLLVLAIFSAKSQTFKPDESTKSSFTDEPAYLIDTVAQSSNNKSQLYSNAMAYITNSFKDSRTVIEMKDPEMGEIVFSGNTVKVVQKELKKKKDKIEYYDDNIRLFFKCHLYLKDNKFKVVLSSLEYPAISLLPGSPKFTLSLKGGTSSINTIDNTAAIQLADGLIKDIAEKLNRKPENEF